MIFSKDFVWLHFPKCAGTMVERLFKQHYPGIDGLFQDPTNEQVDPSVSWHDSLADRVRRDPKFDPSNKVIVCSFRRLTSWLESRYNFEVARSPSLDHDPRRILEGEYLTADGNVVSADYLARKYIPPNMIGHKKVRFIRLEYFQEDFRREFGRFLDVSIISTGEFGVKANSSRNRIAPEYRSIIRSQAENIYRKCPYWAKIENIAYGHPGAGQ